MRTSCELLQLTTTLQVATSCYKSLQVTTSYCAHMLHIQLRKHTLLGAITRFHRVIYATSAGCLFCRRIGWLAL